MADLNDKMPFDDFEIAYDALAGAIDRAGEQKEALFLTKLALLLAHNLKDVKLFQQAVADALKDVEA
jgi:hypothetical protein